MLTMDPKPRTPVIEAASLSGTLEWLNMRVPSSPQVLRSLLSAFIQLLHPRSEKHLGLQRLCFSWTQGIYMAAQGIVFCMPLASRRQWASKRTLEVPG